MVKNFYNKILGILALFFPSLFFITGIGFVTGMIIGYFYVNGVLPTAEAALVIYGMAFGIITVFGIYWAFHSSCHHRKC